jgi:hypothetical protein
MRASPSTICFFQTPVDSKKSAPTRRRSRSVCFGAVVLVVDNKIHTFYPCLGTRPRYPIFTMATTMLPNPTQPSLRVPARALLRRSGSFRETSRRPLACPTSTGGHPTPRHQIWTAPAEGSDSGPFPHTSAAVPAHSSLPCDPAANSIFGHLESRGVILSHLAAEKMTLNGKEMVKFCALSDMVMARCAVRVVCSRQLVFSHLRVAPLPISVNSWTSGQNLTAENMPSPGKETVKFLVVTGDLRLKLNSAQREFAARAKTGCQKVPKSAKRCQASSGGRGFETNSTVKKR